MACEVIADGGHQAMKAILENDYFNWTLRTVVGLVLIVAAIDKAANPGAFAVSIANYKLIGEGPALWVATILPWIELVTGLSVLFGVLRMGGAVVASGLFAKKRPGRASLGIAGFGGSSSAARAQPWKLFSRRGSTFFVLKSPYTVRIIRSGWK